MKKLFVLFILVFYTAVSSANYEYIVKKGDTLSSIAQQFLKNASLWKELVKYNKISDPHLIRPGDKIIIPAEKDKEDILEIEKARKLKDLILARELDKTFPRDFENAHIFLNDAAYAYEKEDFGLAAGLAQNAVDIYEKILTMPSETPAKAGKITFFDGEVLVNGYLATEPVKIEQFDFIQTEKNSYAFLEFDDGSSAFMNENSNLEITGWDDEGATIKTTAGLIRLNAAGLKKAFLSNTLVETEKSELLFLNERNQSVVAVLKGAAKLNTSIHEVEITAGRQAVINQQGAIADFDAAPLTALNLKLNEIVLPEGEARVNFENFSNAEYIHIVYKDRDKKEVLGMKTGTAGLFNSSLSEGRYYLQTIAILSDLTLRASDIISINAVKTGMKLFISEPEYNSIHQTNVIPVKGRTTESSRIIVNNFQLVRDGKQGFSSDFFAQEGMNLVKTTATGREEQVTDYRVVFVTRYGDEFSEKGGVIYTKDNTILFNASEETLITVNDKAIYKASRGSPAEMKINEGVNRIKIKTALNLPAPYETIINVALDTVEPELKSIYLRFIPEIGKVYIRIEAQDAGVGLSDIAYINLKGEIGGSQLVTLKYDEEEEAYLGMQEISPADYNRKVYISVIRISDMLMNTFEKHIEEAKGHTLSDESPEYQVKLKEFKQTLELPGFLAGLALLVVFFI